MRCRTCDTEQPPGATAETLCQHCGHLVGAGASILDRLLALVPHFESTNKHLERMAARAQHKANNIPHDFTASNNATPLASGPLPSGVAIMDLGGPSMGRVWEVRRAWAGGLSVTTAAGGEAWFVKQGAPPTDLNVANLVDFANPLPLTGFYGTHQFFVVQGEHVYVLITGGTNSQQYVAGVAGEDWDVEAYEYSDIES